jgi:hypothetical protein
VISSPAADIDDWVAGIAEKTEKYLRALDPDVTIELEWHARQSEQR